MAATAQEVLGELVQVVEGVATSRAVLELAGRVGVDMPIAEHVVAGGLR